MTNKQNDLTLSLQRGQNECIRWDVANWMGKITIRTCAINAILAGNRMLELTIRILAPIAKLADRVHERAIILFAINAKIARFGMQERTTNTSALVAMSANI